MLVLSRKVGEAIVIGKNIVVKIDRVERGRVYLAFSAPPEVRIYREEIQHKGGDDAADRR